MQRYLGKVSCSPFEVPVVCLQIAGSLQHLRPISTLLPIPRMIRCKGKFQAHLQKDLLFGRQMMWQVQQRNLQINKYQELVQRINLKKIWGTRQASPMMIHMFLLQTHPPPNKIAPTPTTRKKKTKVLLVPAVMRCLLLLAIAALLVILSTVPQLCHGGSSSEVSGRDISWEDVINIADSLVRLFIKPRGKARRRKILLTSTRHEKQQHSK